MDRIDEYLSLYKDKINKMVVKQGPTSEEIYQELCSYKSKPISLEEDVNKIVSYIDDIIKKYISSFLNRGSDIDLVYLNKNKGQYLKYIDISFNKHLPSINEAIQIYLSVNPEKYKGMVIKILELLLSKKMSFRLKLTKVNRNDNLVIYLYSKRDVLSVVEYMIHNNLHQYLHPLNPFIYQIRNIGIVKDANKINYNQYVSNIIQEYVEECILKQQNHPYTSGDLQRFIAKKCEEADNCIDKIMSYNLACFLYAIIKNDDVFKRINDNYIVQYDNDIFKKYKIELKDDEYLYYLNDQEVDFDTKINLNMQQCLYRMYQSSKGEKPTSNYQLNSNIVNTMLKELDEILSYDKCNIFLSYKSKSIQNLVPYLYSSIASKYRHCNEEECKKIIKTINEKITFLDNFENGEYHYKTNEKTFLSTIPIIQLNEGLCAIEYIDKEEKVVNINIIENGDITTYLNVYIDVDYELLNNSTNYYGRLYRSAIASALLNKERNKKRLEIRKSDFGAKFITDNEEEVNKYVNIDMIKKIYHSKSKEIS